MNYFTNQTENYIQEYLNASGITKQQIFNKHLYPPLFKMAEIILNRYFKGFEFDREEADTIINESISKISTNLHLFKSGKAKAYSYCGTVIRNSMNDYFRMKKKQSDRFYKIDYDTLIEHFDRVDEPYQDDNFELIFKYVNHIKTGDTCLQDHFKIELIELAASTSSYKSVNSFLSRFKSREGTKVELRKLKKEFADYMKEHNQNLIKTTKPY